ncbi:MAG: adenylate/guanylate cyclase domain-containing protein [Kiloniellales bacterium]|nr:adenylate/guanylate cyclase domain-containing protein [Kiloniellales bacterium]
MNDAPDAEGPDLGRREKSVCGSKTPRRAIVDWLLEERLRSTRPTLIFDQFCRRLVEAGLPLDRATFHSPQLHPQIRTSGIFWHREAGGAQEMDREHGIEVSPLYMVSPIRHIYEGGAPIHTRIEPGEGKLAFPILEDLRTQGYHDYTIRPLPFSTGRINAIGFSTKNPQGFGAADIALIDAVLPALGAVLELRHLLRTARGLLDAYVGPRTGRKILNGTIKRGDGEEINAVLWYCDLRDFTGMSERLPRDELIALLNGYFEQMAVPIEAHGGEILKFIGDAILAIFPITDGLSPEKACCAAIDAGLEALQGLERLNEARREEGKVPLRCGIALHKGDVMYGNIGAPARLDFTVIGPAVNLVTRIEDKARDLDPPIVFSHKVAERCGRPHRSLGRHAFKGIDGDREVFTLAGEAKR